MKRFRNLGCPLLILGLILSVAVFAPHPARASDGGAAYQLVIKEFGLDTIAKMIAKSFTSQFVHSITNWINSDFSNAGHPLNPANYNRYLQDLADEAGGAFLDEVTDGAFSNIFCSQFKFTIGLSTPRGGKPYEFKARCSLSDAEATTRFYTDFTQGGWPRWLEVARPENNPYGVILMTIEEQERRKNQATEEKKKDLDLGGGFLSVQKCESKQKWVPHSVTVMGEGSGGYYYEEKECENTTPGVVIASQVNKTLGMGQDELVAADELNEVVNALVNFAFRKITGALFTAGRSSSGQGGSYAAGGAISDLYQKEYTLPELLAKIQEIRFALYDSKIVQHDSSFKPAGYEFFYNLKKTDGSYKFPNFKKDPPNNGKNFYFDCAGSSPYDEAAWANCGLLAGRYSKAAGNYLGYDLIASSRGGPVPYTQANYFYRQVNKLRLERFFDEYNQVRMNVASGKAEDYTCKYLDVTVNAGGGSDAVRQDYFKLDQDIREIDGYFGDGGIYDSLINILKRAEKELNKLDRNNPDQETFNMLKEQVLSIITPNPAQDLIKRLDDMMYYSGTYPCVAAFANPSDPCYQYDSEDYKDKFEEKYNYRSLTNVDEYYGTNNLHCWNAPPAFDEYCAYSEVITLKAGEEPPRDSCNNDTRNTFACEADDDTGEKTCTDIYQGEISGEATGGSGGSGGSQNSGGSGGSGGTATFSTNYYKRLVHCSPGKGKVDEYSKGDAGSYCGGSYDPDGEYGGSSGLSVAPGGRSFNYNVYDGYTLEQCQADSDFIGCMMNLVADKFGLNGGGQPNEYSVIKRCQLELSDSAGYRSALCGYSSYDQVANCLVGVYNSNDNPGSYCTGITSQSACEAKAQGISEGRERNLFLGQVCPAP